MSTINPFHGWYYNPEKVSIARVIAPPYDVISKEGEVALHEKDPHNVIRLILGHASPEDLRRPERYEQAKKHFHDWIDSGVLSRDQKKSFYLYEMRYKHPFLNEVRSRLALFGVLKVEPFERKIVFPHEQTHSSPKVDRGKLIRAAKANFSPVFSVYEDPSETLDEIRGSCEERTPLFEFKDEADVHHKLWVIDDVSEVGRIEKAADGKRVFIADGHHRYETALQYSEEMKGKAGYKGGQGSDYVLGTFVRFTDPGLLILPIHRVISSQIPVDHDEFLNGLKKHFVLHSVSRQALEKISQGTITEGFGIALGDNGCFIAELKDKTTARQAMPEGKVQSWYDLDVNLLSYLILKPVLRIQDKDLEHVVTYTPSVSEAFDKVTAGESNVAFFIRPLSMQTIKEICESGEVMPQKSTYFFPKFPSGLVMYRHEEPKTQKTRT